MLLEGRVPHSTLERVVMTSGGGFDVAWELGERKALAEWRMTSVHAEESRDDAVWGGRSAADLLVDGRGPEWGWREEIVGLGFLLAGESGVMMMLWVELENTADRHSKAHEFYVEPQHIHAVLNEVYAHYGNDAHPWVLWHSHYRSPVASDRDIMEFPDWLVSEARIYHAPTQATSKYSGSGTIPPEGNSLSPLLEIVPGGFC